MKTVKLRLIDDIDKFEPQWNSQTFKNLVGALPNEVPHKEHVRIVEEFIEPFVAQGMIAIVAIHEGINIEEPWKSNPHMHLLLTIRPVKSPHPCRRRTRPNHHFVMPPKWKKPIIPTIVSLWFSC
jgi:hypothetical protein